MGQSARHRSGSLTSARPASVAIARLSNAVSGCGATRRAQVKPPVAVGRHPSHGPRNRSIAPLLRTSVSPRRPVAPWVLWGHKTRSRPPGSQFVVPQLGVGVQDSVRPIRTRSCGPTGIARINIAAPRARPGRDLQAIRGAGPLAGAGVRFIPVVHEGNTHPPAEEAESIAGLIDELLGSGARWVDDSGVERPLALEDTLVITPYNAQVREIRERLPSARVRTVDKFQGQEAPLSIYSLAASSAEDAPRGLEFVLSLNRLNVATSRARCVSAVVGNPRLLTAHCKTPSQMRLANSLARFVELANQD